MYLKSLQISGFKSFARKTTLTFSRGITAIVGPNGSGKSNISDGIRWVMGEQSIKTLRGKKSEDVIFSGSDKKTRLGLAEVSLELDNTDKQVPIDYSDLLISRRIYRNGESEYLINNSKSKLGDINLLLTKANFGHRTYSVIGQGMIDNFLIASPAERKEFFEEATGVKQYQIKKNQALNKLENVWQNLNTLKIKTGEMEPNLRLLTRQVKKLKKRKKLEAELIEARLTYFSSYWHEIDSDYLSKKTEIDKLNSHKDSIEAKWQNLEKKLNTLAKDTSSNEEINKLRDTEQDLLTKKMELKEKLLTIRVQAANSETISPTKNISRNELEEVNYKIQSLRTSHKKIIDLIDKNENNQFIKKEIIDLNKKIDQLLKFIEPYIKPVITKSEPPGKNNKITGIESNISEINQRIYKIQSEIKTLQDKDATSRSNLFEFQKNFQTSQNELNQINAKINELRISLARTETKRFELKREINYELNGLENLSKDSIKKLSEQDRLTYQNKINRFKNSLEVIGGLDPEIEAEFEATEKRYNFLTQQVKDLENTSESLKKLVGELDDIIKKQIRKSFTEINKHFQKYFRILFEGGRAELTLVKEKVKKDDTHDDGEEENQAKTAKNFFQEKNRAAGFSGIDVSATPPGKRLKSVSALSGGERALTSIALISAIISSNPAPFVFLDEVDAALDEANSIRFADILASLSNRTQFIVITHNRTTMERASLLYGVTMGDDGISKLLSIKLEEAHKFKPTN